MTDKNLIDLTQKTPAGTDHVPIWPNTVTSANDLKYSTVDSVSDYAENRIKGHTIAYKGDIVMGTAASTVGTLHVGSVPDGIPLVTYGSTATGASWGQLANGGIADNAVTTSKIANGSVTIDKISLSSVDISEHVYLSIYSTGETAPSVSVLANYSVFNNHVEGSVLMKITGTGSTANGPLGVTIDYWDDLGIPAIRTGGLTSTIPEGIGVEADDNTSVHAGSGYYYKADVGIFYSFIVRVNQEPSAFFVPTMTFRFVNAGYVPNDTGSGGNSTGIFGSTFNPEVNDQISFSFRYEIEP